jgi:iron-sulfur cluster assembly accessory protein
MDTMTDTTQTPVSVSARAAKQISKILAKETAPKMLRVSVSGGGCSGFQYLFDLTDTRNDDDLAIERDGVTVLVDETSLPFMEGSEIEASCGCGTSFSI